MSPIYCPPLALFVVGVRFDFIALLALGVSTHLFTFFPVEEVLRRRTYGSLTVLTGYFVDVGFGMSDAIRE